MLFTYWTHSEIEVPPAAPAWQKIYPEFRVFTDKDIGSLIPVGISSIFEKIRLPSAKSDLIRFLLLRKYGGLYIDAHIGPTSPACLLATLDKLSAYNLILFGKGWAMKSETDFDLMNGVLAARKGAPELDIAINMIIANIIDQAKKERLTTDYVPYNLFYLCGTYVLIKSYFDQVDPRPRIKTNLDDRIFVHYMIDNFQSGFEIAAFYNYRKPGGHWSERQMHERFLMD